MANQFGSRQVYSDVGVSDDHVVEEVRHHANVSHQYRPSDWAVGGFAGCFLRSRRGRYQTL